MLACALAGASRSGAPNVSNSVTAIAQPAASPIVSMASPAPSYPLASSTLTPIRTSATPVQSMHRGGAGEERAVLEQEISESEVQFVRAMQADVASFQRKHQLLLGKHEALEAKHRALEDEHARVTAERKKQVFAALLFACMCLMLVCWMLDVHLMLDALTMSPGLKQSMRVRRLTARSRGVRRSW